MFIVLGVLLFVAWILGFGMYHVASFGIHVLLILAVISIVFHFLRGGKTTRAI